MKTLSTWERYKRQQAKRRRTRTTLTGRATLLQRAQRLYHRLTTPSRWVRIGIPLKGLDTAQEEH